MNVTTLAGSGKPGFLDGEGAKALFHHPSGLAVDGHDNVYVADMDSHSIRKITPEGLVCTLAGTGEEGFVDGDASQALFSRPEDVKIDSHGNVIVADTNNYRIRKVTSRGYVSTLAGRGQAGHVDRVGTNAQFKLPLGIALDPSGCVLVSDADVIRKVSPAGEVTTFVKCSDSRSDEIPGFVLRRPHGLAVDESGNVFVADRDSCQIFRIDPNRKDIPLVAKGKENLSFPTLEGLVQNADLNDPTGVAVAKDGKIFIADYWNHRIACLQPDGSVITVAGSGEEGFADGPGKTAKFNFPYSVTINSKGELLVADQLNHRIRKISND